MARLEFAIRRIEAAREDTKRFLEDLSDDEWFAQPFEGANHIAWQVGHLATAEYGIVVGEALGRTFADVDWLTDDFRTLFRRESVPQSDAGSYPQPTEIVAMLDRVHRHALDGLATVSDDLLDEPSAHGHPLAETRLDALHLCAWHEGVHTGQIAMLRRAIGRPPMR